MSLVELLRSMDKPLLDQGPFIEIRGALREASNRIEQLEKLNAEMLEALEVCEGIFMRYEINSVDGEDIADYALKIISAAISKAKAKGKTE